MLRFFRSSSSIVIVVVFLLAGLTWIHALVHPVQPDDKYGVFLYSALDGWIDQIPGLNVWCGLFVTLLAAALMITVNNRLHLIDKISYLPALCYVILIGGVPMVHQFNPAAVASIFLIAGFIQLIGSFKSEQLSYRYFTASMFISTAMFFYQYMCVYMLAIWFAILFLRPGYWREWVFSILGFSVPVFYAFCWFFLVEDDFTRIGVFFENIFSVQRFLPQLSTSTILFLIISIVLAIFAFGHLMRYLGSRKTFVRNGYYVLILIAIITIALSAIVPDSLPSTWYLIAFPMSFFLSNYLATVRSIRWGTIVLMVLFVGMMIAQII